ncbi:unnamed protein product [Rotaria socialis]|uniref:Homeobox domain-containing protein n=1 Tax=Rotaria socialis TaxID=392032 RepID=A0A818F2N8_9BILA|nr:unnamed protein product [Rotaria socialis]CAF4450639.1 unnamed protein product [Rotaria socialis]
MENELHSYEETIAKSSNSSSPTFNSCWFAYSSLFNSVRPTTPKVRHNFKSIDELLSPLKTNDETGYNSQLSSAFRSQNNGDENEKPTKSSRSQNKSKTIRTAFTDEQREYLDRFYSTNRYPDPSQIETLSQLLSLDEKVVRVWFQNKRSREKSHPRNSTMMNTM